MLTEEDIKKLIATLVEATEALKLLKKGKMRPKDELLDDTIGDCVGVLKTVKEKLKSR